MYIVNIKILIPLHFRRNAFPYGLNHVYFWLTNHQVMIILTAPGNFYNRDRYFNEVNGDGNRDLSFTMRLLYIYNFTFSFYQFNSYSFYEKLQGTCKGSLDWKMDDCKLGKVIKSTHHGKP